MPPDETEHTRLATDLPFAVVLYHRYTEQTFNYVKRHYLLLVLSVTLSMLLTVLCIMCLAYSNVLQNTNG